MAGKKAEERSGNYQRRINRNALPGLGKALDALQPQGVTLLDAVRELFPKIEAAMERNCDCFQIAKTISEKTGVRMSGKTLVGYIRKIQEEKDAEDTPPAEPVKSVIIQELEQQSAQQLEPEEGDANGRSRILATSMSGDR